MECPKCGEVDIWDACYGHCWRCDYGKQIPMPLWQKIIFFIPALIVLGLE